MPEITTRYGRMIVPDVTRDIVGSFLSRYGEWAEYEIRFIADNIRSNTRIADIGAFVGSFGIGLSQQKSLETICFVEANPSVFDSLRANVEANCKCTSDFVEAILCPRDYDPAPPHQTEDNQGSTSFANATASFSDSRSPLPLARLDFKHLWEKHGPFDLIKLDVEGMELPILKDARNQLRKSGTQIWVECNDEPASLQLAEFLLSCGLNVYYFAFPSFNPDNFLANPKPRFPYAYEAGLLATRNQPTVDKALLHAGCFFQEIKDSEELRAALWRTPRWVPAEWVYERPEETIAIAVHAHFGHQYDHYLKESMLDSGSLEDGQPAAEVWGQGHELTAYRKQLKAQTDLLHELTARCKQLETQSNQRAALNQWAEALALDRLKLLSAERKLRIASEQRLRRLEQRYRAAEKRYQEVVLSSSWRVTRPVRTLLSKAPRLRRYLRQFARTVVRSLKPR